MSFKNCFYFLCEKEKERKQENRDAFAEHAMDALRGWIQISMRREISIRWPMGSTHAPNPTGGTARQNKTASNYLLAVLFWQW